MLSPCFVLPAFKRVNSGQERLCFYFEESVFTLSPSVPNINSIQAVLPDDSIFYTVVDLCLAYYSVSVHENIQGLFIFLYKDKEYVWS